jgi:hypothetical protein
MTVLAVPLPAMVSVPALPAPAMLGNALDSVMLPLTLNTMVSSVAAALASRMACRSVPAPLSARLETVNVSALAEADMPSIRQTTQPAHRRQFQAPRTSITSPDTAPRGADPNAGESIWKLS